MILEKTPLRKAPCDQGLSLVIAFDYYDGPERGLALWQGSRGVRFSSLGDSRSRCFRAFELALIAGQWNSKAEALIGRELCDSVHRVWVPSEEGEVLERLDADVTSAEALEYFVGVGLPNLNQLAVISLDLELLQSLRNLNGSPAAFQKVHQMIKNSKA